jgi:hypothetical protein
MVPSVQAPAWSLQVPIPQNSRIHLLFNGFCGYFEQKKKRMSAEVLIPEPGVCWGRFSNIPAPVLVSETAPEDTGGYQWMDHDTAPALLAIRGDTFCLVTRAHIAADAVKLAEACLAADFEHCLREEFDRRSGAVKLFEQLNHHDALTVISTEHMMRSLRPAEGNIPGPWSQSPASDTPHLNTNEVYALVMAWRHIDIGTAEDLLRTVLHVQTSSGAIPVLFAPHETYSVLEAPKPLLAKAAEALWKAGGNTRFLEDILPHLRRHLQWLLHHFDPKRRGLHCWQNSSEPLTPEIYESDLATVDLTVLLLSEIEALERLRRASPEESQFVNAVLRGRMTKVRGFPAFVPLWWSKLPLTQRGQVFERIRESGNLPGGVSLLSWRKSALEDSAFPLLQQLLVLEILKATDPHGTLISGFSRLIMQGFVEWHKQSVDEYQTLRMDAVTAAFIINLQESRHGGMESGNRLADWGLKLFRKTRTDWFDIAVVAASILAIFAVREVYRQLRQPPPLIMLESELNSGYANKDIERALKAGQAIIRHYPEESLLAKFLTANVLLIQHRYEEAEILLADVREVYPDSPGPMIALGLAQQLQGRFQEADKNYAEFCYLFGDIFPELVESIEKNRHLMAEGFRAPPKWSEIYRYQLMHEL